MLLAILLLGCATPKTFTANYYYENEASLIDIEKNYREIDKKKHFSVAFTDRSFNYISIEFITDTLKYIYEFEMHEPRLKDSLTKYGLKVANTLQLLEQMKKIHCSWINNLDYYANDVEQSLVLISIRHVAFRLPFLAEKYYILTFYAQPQYYDNEGLLLDSRRIRKIRKINDDIFRRVNDKVAYTISGRFR